MLAAPSGFGMAPAGRGARRHRCRFVPGRIARHSFAPGIKSSRAPEIMFHRDAIIRRSRFVENPRFKNALMRVGACISAAIHDFANRNRIAVVNSHIADCGDYFPVSPESVD
ncbi:hypothetical protein ACV229_03595 [Burkholderia sp. MR1-5-21]